MSLWKSRKQLYNATLGNATSELYAVTKLTAHSQEPTLCVVWCLIRWSASLEKNWSYMMPNVFTETRCHYATLPTVLFHVIPSTDTFTLTSHLVYIKRKTVYINNSNNTLSIHVFLFWLCCTFYCLKLALPSEVIKFVYIPIQTPEEYLI